MCEHQCGSDTDKVNFIDARVLIDPFPNQAKKMLIEQQLISLPCVNETSSAEIIPVFSVTCHPHSYPINGSGHMFLVYLLRVLWASMV